MGWQKTGWSSSGVNRPFDTHIMIFKRKSFHLFKEIGQISCEELSAIEEAYRIFTPLVGEVRTGIRIVPGDQTTCKRGQEYCILLYSEKRSITYRISDIWASSWICIWLRRISARCGLALERRRKSLTMERILPL